MINFGSSIDIAIKTLKTNKGRTFLTLLGVVIGITAVIVVMSAGNGLEQFITEEIEAFGSDTIEVEIKVPNTEHTSTENATGFVGGVSVTTLTLEDAEAVLDHPNITDAYSGLMSQDLASYQGEVKKTFLFGVTSSFLNIDKGEVEKGRFYTEEEDRSLAKVVVLGSEVKERLFGEGDAVGERIKINRTNYRVVGVMKERGAMMFFNWDEMIYIPVETLQKRIMGIDHISFIFAKMADPSLGDQTVDEVREIIRERHGTTSLKDDDFAVISMEQASEMLDVVFIGLRILLLALVSISLIVGGVGIMNIMYVSVTERTGEIGLRKAMGARRSDILSQFLWESLIISFIAGIIGIVLGNLVSWFIALAAASQGFAWDFQISVSAIVLAVGFSAAVGLLFGIYPARRAASFDPIQALRFE
jgi:ABC-type antimicrobial peptide transport system permease subunit